MVKFRRRKKLSLTQLTHIHVIVQLVWVWFSLQFTHLFQDRISTATIFILTYKVHPRNRLQLISASHLSCFRFHLKHHFVIILLWWSGYITMPYLQNSPSLFHSLTHSRFVANYLGPKSENKSYLQAMGKKAKETYFGEMAKMRHIIRNAAIEKQIGRKGNRNGW